MYWSCCTSFPPKLKERDWKIRSTKVDAGNLKHELLNRLLSILAVNVPGHYVTELFDSKFVVCNSDNGHELQKLAFRYVLANDYSMGI
jgi:hypothetical protein